MSDRMPGLTGAFFLVVAEPTSSGADQRSEASPPAFDPLTDCVSLAIEERPKSARQGDPCALMNILYYKK